MAGEGGAPHLRDADFKRLWTYMYQHYGINLERKKTLVEGRLAAAVTQEGFSSYTEYIDDVLTGGGEKLEGLVSRLTTNYTYFMREDGHYGFLQRAVLPEWTQKIRNGDLRIWSAGCSSGEEPYSIAMILDEYFGGGKAGWDTQILATDVSAKVLGEAALGVYPASRLAHVSGIKRLEYFTPAGGDAWRVSERIMREVVFARFNLMDSFDRFRRPFHVIFCRNVMIYFDGATRAALAKKFYDVLEPGGYLFLGLSETMSGTRPGFEAAAPAVYRKLSGE